MQALRQNTLVRIIEDFEEEHPDAHLKDLVVDESGPGREIVVGGRRVINFGSDSFLGLDQDPRVQEAIRRGPRALGHAQRRLAGLRQRPGQHRGRGEARRLAGHRGGADLSRRSRWPTMGAIPGLVGRQDVIVLDEQAHNSMQEGAKIAKANGAKVATFAHCDPATWSRRSRGSALPLGAWSASTASTA